MNVADETWRTAIDPRDGERLVGYEISDAGRCRCSLSRSKLHVSEPRIQSGTISASRGYPQLRYSFGGPHASKNRHPRKIQAARLVLATFRGPPSFGEVAIHLNGDACDNRLANLAWAPRLGTRR